MAEGFHGLTEQLFAAVKENNLVELQKFCSSVPKARSLLSRQRDSDGSSAFLIAANYGHWKASKFLLDLGADINQANIYGWSALLLCIYNRDVRYFRKLIAEPGLDLNPHNLFGHSALTIAVGRNCPTILQDLLSAGANVNFRASHSFDGLTPLMLACFKGSRQMVARLLSHGAEVNTQNKLNMWTPLMYAATKHYAGVTDSIVRLLLEYGADYKVRNRIGMTCVDIASECGNEEFLSVLQTESDSSSWPSSGLSESKKILKRTAIFDAIESKNRPLILSLIHGEKQCINEVDSVTGMSPLIFSILENDITAVKVLLDFGADIETQHAKTGFTPLMYAVLCHSVDIVRLLLSRGADQSARGNIFGSDEDSSSEITFTARDIASMNNYSDIIDILDSHKKDSEERTANMPQYVMKKLRYLIHHPNFLTGHLMNRSLNAARNSDKENIVSPIRNFFSFKKRRNTISTTPVTKGKLDRSTIFFSPRFDSDNNHSATSSTSTMRSTISATPPRIPFNNYENPSLSAVEKLFDSISFDINIYKKNRSILDGEGREKLLKIQSDRELLDIGIADENDRQALFLAIVKVRQQLAIAEVEKIRKHIETIL